MSDRAAPMDRLRLSPSVRRALFTGLAALWMAGPARAEPPPAVALVVAVDVSQSVDEARFTLQMEGIAAALEDPGVIAAMTGRPGGTLFAMVTWADQAGLALNWQRIATRADALATAARVRATPRQSGEFTCLGQMFRTVAASVIPAMPLPAERIVVDVSGDGIDNCTDPDNLEAEQQTLLGTGATINGLPILVPGENDVVGAGAYRAPGYGLRATPLPQDRTDLAQWYRAHVVGGPGAFLLAAAGYGDFSKAIRRKFVIEVSDAARRMEGSPALDPR
ncbi:tRNA delta(2)-isopentenylpyrophosphate transferase [Methylorubrum zatmanii]|nr:tRNA delta(2)-isopentenylpyrophosphate transferase [Methylorubrum zatmanii]